MSKFPASRQRPDRAFGSNRSESGQRGSARRSASGPSQHQASHPRVPRAVIRIDQVQRLLGEVLQWTYPADATLSHWFRAHPTLGGRDRGEVAEAVYDVLRHLRRYRQLAESGSGAASRRLAILGLAATVGPEFLEDGLDPDEREWLQRVSRIDTSSLPRAVRASMPEWLDERLGRLEDAESLMAALNRPAALDLRVNPLKMEREAALAALADGPAARYEPQPMPYSPWGIRVAGRPAVNRWPLFENGSLEVQDEGSQLLALLVAPRRGEMIIDFCAGAGGKTLLLGALMRSTGRLYAFDVSAARLARAKPRFARSGLSNVVPVAIDSENDARVKRLAGKAQRVLVDAPCSGIGTLRRNPDLKWRQHPEALSELTALQTRIFNSAARCVAPGGRLVYATCSLLAEENEAQVEQFLATHPDFVQLDAAEILKGRCPDLAVTGPNIQLRPDVHGTDGFFAAVLERRKAPAVGKASAVADSAESGEVPEESLVDADGVADAASVPTAKGSAEQ
nr:RsmB/NOP family class I SAM-dependent RNA methyltransferase [Bordetella sp. 02P26C-1]